MSQTRSYLTDHDAEELRHAEKREARRIRNKRRMREYLRTLEQQREDDDD